MIRKRGQKYQARCRINGRLYEKTFDTLNSAEQWVSKTKLKYNDKTLKITSQNEVVSSKTVVKAVVKEVRFADLILKYQQVYTSVKNGKDNEDIIINRILRDEPWVQLAPDSVTLDDLTAYRDSRLQTIKPSTFKREFAILKHCAKVSKALGFDGVNVEIFQHLPIPRIYERPVPRITNEDIERLLFIARYGATRNKYMHPLILLALDTGMRRGECCGLVWGDIDMAKQVINVPAAITKTGKPRTIAFTKRGLAALLDLKHLAQKPYKTKAVPSRFGPEHPVVPATGNGVRMAWQRVRKSAGLSHLHFHDLRHEGISRMHEEGITVTEVMGQSGHSESKMLDRYSHADIDRVRQIRGGLYDA